MNTPEIVNALVTENFNLAHYFAHRHCRWMNCYDDALSVAMHGLLRAARSYKQTGTQPKFGTYASICIRWEYSKERKKREAQCRGHGIWHDSFDAPIAEGYSTTVGETVADENALSATAAIQTIENCQEVEQLLSLLSERDRTIVELRYGFNGKKPLLLGAIGKRFGLTSERVRQIEAGALRKFWRLKQRKKLEPVTAAQLKRVA